MEIQPQSLWNLCCVCVQQETVLEVKRERSLIPNGLVCCWTQPLKSLLRQARLVCLEVLLLGGIEAEVTLESHGTQSGYEGDFFNQVTIDRQRLVPWN